MLRDQARTAPSPAFDRSFAAVGDNLAADEAVLVAAEDRAAGPVLRFWEQDRPAVILGASCRLHENARVDACRADGVPIARRSSGGGTVVIGPGALNVTLVLPIASDPAFASVDTAQRAVLERVAAALRAAGPAVAMLGSGDLTLGGRKFSGSAQRRLRHHLMIHFSVLYDFDLPLIARYTHMPPRQPGYRADRPHDDFVVNLPLGRAAIVAAVRSTWGGESATAAGYPVPADLIAELARTKFGASRWIERL